MREESAKGGSGDRGKAAPRQTLGPEALVVICAPRTLGTLRKHYHGEVEKRVIGEIAKDVAGRPTSEIARVIANN